MKIPPFGRDFQGIRIYRSDVVWLGGADLSPPVVVIVRDEFTGLSLGDGCFPAVPASVLAGNQSIGRNGRRVEGFWAWFLAALAVLLLPRQARGFQASVGKKDRAFRPYGPKRASRSPRFGRVTADTK